MSDNDKDTQRRWVKKKKAGTEVWFGTEPQDLPYKKLGPLNRELFASYTGPDNGLVLIQELENGRKGSPTKRIAAGAERWNLKNRKCYGICMSLYDQHPINGKISGDPIADSFALCARRNNACMIVADGVNWGEKSKMAARCAVYGSMKHINSQLFGSEALSMKTTHDVFSLLLRTIHEAQQTILKHQAGLTTLCVALVLPTRNPKQYLVCVVNVGDSLAYVYSKFHGIREITTGSHDIQSERDIRDAGGALGPVHGDQPELNNLTCSMTFVDLGDIIYLTTDGISDNFDPVVTKIAVAKRVAPMKVHDDIDPIAEEVENSGKDTLNSNSQNGNEKGENTLRNISESQGVDKCDCGKGTGNQDLNAGEVVNGNQIISQKDSSHKSQNIGGLNNMQQVSISGVNNSEKVTETNGNSRDTSTHATQSGDKTVTVTTGNNNQGNKSTTLTSDLRSENTGNSEVTKTGSKDTAKSSHHQKNAQTLGCGGDQSPGTTTLCGVQDGKPEMEPHERHCYAVKEMERIILEYELFTEDVCCAQELCGALLQHVLKLTDSKRKVLENPNLYRKRVKKKDKEKRDSEIYAALGKAPGKLDHATIIAYEVGRFHGDEDEDYERSDPELDAFGSDAGSSVTASVNDLANTNVLDLSTTTTNEGHSRLEGLPLTTAPVSVLPGMPSPPTEECEEKYKEIFV